MNLSVSCTKIGDIGINACDSTTVLLLVGSDKQCCSSAVSVATVHMIKPIGRLLGVLRMMWVGFGRQ